MNTKRFKQLGDVHVQLLQGQKGRAGGELGQDEVGDFKTDGSDEVKHGIKDKLKMARRKCDFCEIKVFRNYLKVAVLLTLTPCSIVNIGFI